MDLGFTFKRERVADLWGELEPLAALHKQEFPRYADYGLNIDHFAYEAMDDAGVLRMFTARVDGKLVGYCSMIVRAHPHLMGSLQALEDVLYVAKEHRHGLFGINFIKAVDEALKAEGVQEVARCTQTPHEDATPTHGRLLEHLGYYEKSVNYARRLDKE